MKLGKLPLRLLKTENPVLHSPSILASSWVRRINQSDADIVHLHWMCNEMMSVNDIGRVEKPVVWTLPDMWPFCGAEHFTDDDRFREGYSRANRPDHEAGFDLNRWTWKRKLRAWRRPMQIVTASNWLADCARKSVLMRDWPATVILNAIDTEVWRPIEKSTARRLLNLPEDGRLLVFGATSGGKDPRKGADLLFEALDHLSGQIRGLELIIFGERQPAQVPDVGIPIHYAGGVHDDLRLRVLYSAGDAMVIPSRQDNLPNTGVEALACGTPLIAFDTGGLPDLVVDRQTGRLAKAFDTEDMAQCIMWMMEDKERLARLSRNARDFAKDRFAAPAVARQYKQLYEAVLAGC